MANVLLVLGLVLVLVPRLLADDQTRQVQEELRKRHLYFGDINGLPNTELESALKRYQARKGFAVTGRIDGDTASSLGIAATLTEVASNPPLPNEPILRNDFARELSPEQRQQLEEQRQHDDDAFGNNPPPPAESPPPVDELTRQRVTQLVQDYLRAGESNDPAAQSTYYAFPLDYMHDGLQTAAYVERDASRQIRKWPRRKFMLSGPVTCVASPRDGELIVDFNYAYEEVGDRTARGQVHQQWRVRADGDGLKITKIDEHRLPVPVTATR